MIKVSVQMPQQWGMVCGGGREASMEWDGKEKLKDRMEEIGTYGEDFALMITDL